MFSQEIIDHLKVLGIKEENYETLTMDDAVKAYRKLAMTVHPDKAGKESTAAFQNLNNSYEKVLEFLITNLRPNTKGEEHDENVDDIVSFARDNFKNLHFPKEHVGCFVVDVQDCLADIWEETFRSVYGDAVPEGPKDGKQYGSIWKTLFLCEGQEEQITIHFYNKPKGRGKKSKIMVQGKNKALMCIFVFEQLPLLYKEVCKKKPTLQSPAVVPKTKRKSNVSCVK